MKDLTNLLDKYNQKYTIVDDKVVGFDIYLAHKNLTTLPESIGNLVCTYLYLYKNNLTSLPILNNHINILHIDNFDDLSNLLYLPNLIELWIGKEFYIKERLQELLNNIRHQKVMNDMNKILEII